MEKLQYELITLPSYKAMGVKWEGPYTEVGSLKNVILQMSERVGELPSAVEPEVQLGLSYHLRPDGFVHYSVFRVEEEQGVPEGMVDIRVPEMTYLKVLHEKGQDFGHTYTKIYQWFKQNDYILFKESGVDYFDDLPIKHERYPVNRDLNDPHFEILIPIAKSV
ncbi:GyrI-like domain-containing protein [Bacillus tianshenii]|uniref:GyrI-like domain-containing protein n=1 Tax=Sutcliffiella tianshenii TaxID=1463404 RepID=UPI001CD39786|nr:GyrI-like domain-containing protein [Bacillus tianshenii]MCA1320629.1 GyrI-like domain-containing protein [Bacillus tianshenii]